MKPSDEDHKQSFDFYIDTIIQYQKLFNYSGDIQSILSLPYPLLENLMISKLKEKQTEMKRLEDMKNNGSNKRGM